MIELTETATDTIDGRNPVSEFYILGNSRLMRGLL